MSVTATNPDFITGITSLYYLLIHADGDVNDKEIESGLKMVRHEGIDEAVFFDNVNKCKNIDKEVLFRGSINALHKCDEETQVRTVAWISRVADSDGYVDPNEWELIYRTYELELKLDLRKILAAVETLPA